MAEETQENIHLWKYKLECSNKHLEFHIDDMIKNRADNLGFNQENIEIMTRHAIRSTCDLFGVLEEDLPLSGVEVVDFNQPGTVLDKLRNRVDRNRRRRFTDDRRMTYDLEKQKISINFALIEEAYKNSRLSLIELRDSVEQSLIHEVSHAASKVFLIGSARNEHVTVDNLRTRKFLRELPALAGEYVAEQLSGAPKPEQLFSKSQNRINFFKNLLLNISNFEDKRKDYNRIYSDENLLFAHWLLVKYGAEHICKLQDIQYTSIQEAFDKQYGKNVDELLKEFASEHLHEEELEQVQWLATQEEKWGFFQKSKPYQVSKTKFVFENFLPINIFETPEAPNWINELKIKFPYLSFNAFTAPYTKIPGRYGVVLEPVQKKIILGRWEKGIRANTAKNQIFDDIEEVFRSVQLNV